MFFKRKKVNRQISIPYKKLIIESKKAVYFEIPKVACTSINFLLIRMFIRVGEKFVVQKVHTDEDLPREFGVLDEKYNQYFKFAFVRHPLTRVQSCFLDKIKPLGYDEEGAYENGLYLPFKKYGKLFWPGMNFDEFVLAISKISDVDADPHFRSQSCFISDANNALMVDFVGRFERLESDINYLLSKLGNPTNSTKVPVVNKQERPENWRIDGATRQLIVDRYQRDFEIFEFNTGDSDHANSWNEKSRLIV